MSVAEEKSKLSLNPLEPTLTDQPAAFVRRGATLK